MLSLSSRERVFVAREPVEFRRGIDSLYALVRDGFGEDAFSGDLFAFFNRARDRIKIMVFDRNGFWLHLKRLERGRFESIDVARAKDGCVEIDALRLQLLLEGIERRSVKSKKLQDPVEAAVDAAAAEIHFTKCQTLGVSLHG